MAEDVATAKRQATQRAGLVAAAAAAFEAQLARAWRAIERQLAALLPAQPAENPFVVGAEANAVRFGISQTLKTTLDPMLETAFRFIDPGLGPAFATMAVTLQHEQTQVAGLLWHTAMRGLYRGRSGSQLRDDLSQILDASDGRLRTLYDTSVSIFMRQQEVTTADPSPETSFLYVGPDDDVTRPFCREHVGHVLTRAEIDDLDNGQLPDVFLTGGGYNCRHSWIELSKASELRPGDVAPELRHVA